ncbi:MAG: sugar MFS transporter [Cytophagaceae bacterium]|jgi:FHS family L-fucose permease-like MFS transporter|nr:sugar MFS transporter [Cytophagaceae bacterium]
MAGGASNTETFKVEVDKNQKYVLPLIVLTSLFFMWAVATNFNDILMPKLKAALNLTHQQTSFVQVFFFLGYGLMSIPAGIIIKKVGYKAGILIGLLTCASGAALFIPAANFLQYELFLAALFVLAGGITFLQVAANAYVAVLGDPKSASARLNLSQAFNSIGAFGGPLFASMVMLDGDNSSVESVKMPYMLLAVLFILVAVIIGLSKLPKISGTSEFVNPFSAFKFRHTTMATIAIFFYVGAEVAIGSYFVQFTEHLDLNLTEKQASIFISAYMACAALGRFLGAGLLTRINPGKAVGFNALGAVVLILICVFGSGYVSLVSLVLIGLMNSIMFPTIFTLGVAKLGDYTEAGSSLIITAILGGAVITPAMAYVIDKDPSLFNISYLIPAACYLFIAYFGFKGSDSSYLDKK